MPKVSVIVPVCNQEAHLGWCINSILSQTMRDLELILVDDGSTDGSLEICENYAQLDQRVQVIHQENGGISNARNHGIDEAKGEYIQFVDGNDWIPSNFTETLLNAMEKRKTDIVFCNIKIVKLNEYSDPEIELLTSADIDVKNILSGEEFWNKIMYLFYATNLLEIPCNQLYRASAIKNNQIYFSEDKSGKADGSFNLTYYNTSNAFTFVCSVSYYRIKYNGKDLNAKYDDNLFENQLTQLRLIWSLIEQHKAINEENQIYWEKYCVSKAIKALEAIGRSECQLSPMQKQEEIKKIVCCPEVQNTFLKVKSITGSGDLIERMVRNKDVLGLYHYITDQKKAPMREKEAEIQSGHFIRNGLIKCTQIVQKFPLAHIQNAAKKIEKNLVTLGGKRTLEKILQRLRIL